MTTTATQAPTRGFTDSTDLLADSAALRERGERDGYLFFKQRLPREAVMNLRREILEILNADGVIDASRPIDEAWANLQRVGEYHANGVAAYGVGVPHELYLAIQKLQSFHALPHHPNLLEIYTALLGGTVFPHPRHICRIMVPNTPVTPPHQDFTHIQGTQNVWTCWFPIGDCPLDLGGLSVLEGSNHAGLLPVKPADGAGGIESWLCDMDNEWLAQDLEAGDVLTFYSHTVHRSVPNHYDRIRLSYDCRYQRTDEPLTELSIAPHMSVAPWEELYEGWTREDLQYYWKQYELETSAVMNKQILAGTRELC